MNKKNVIVHTGNLGTCRDSPVWIVATHGSVQQAMLLASKLWCQLYLCFCQVSVKLATEHAIKKYLYKNPPSISLSRHSTACPEFQVPTVLLIPKQFRECLPTHKHNLLLFTPTLGWKQPDFWLLTCFWFHGYYYVDSFAMQEAGMAWNIKSTPIKLPHDNITL